MTPDKRIQALAEGRPVGEVCPCTCHDYHHAYVTKCSEPSIDCGGDCTGRIRTAPEGPAEEAVAKLVRDLGRAKADAESWRQSAFKRDDLLEKRTDERDAALARAERAESRHTPIDAAVMEATVIGLTARVQELEGALRRIHAWADEANSLIGRPQTRVGCLRKCGRFRLPPCEESRDEPRPDRVADDERPDAARRVVEVAPMIDLDALDALYAAATPGEWRTGSAKFHCFKHETPHPGPPACKYDFDGWYGDDDDSSDRYFSRFVSQVEPPREIIGSNGHGPILSREDAVALVALHNQYPALARELRAARALRSELDDDLQTGCDCTRCEAIRAYDAATGGTE